MIPRAGMKNDRPLVCGCLGECSPEEFPGWLRHPEADMVEWRMDKFAGGSCPPEIESCLRALSSMPRLPVIATNRPVREMGAFAGPEDLRLGMLEEAAKSGADWIDLEHDAAADHVAVFRKAGARILLSWHSPDGTPPKEILRAKLENMYKRGADALKIVTLARSHADNLKVLELIPMAAEEFGVDLVAFCMGPAGMWSRVVSVFLGSPWTYAQFEGRLPTAPGQLSVSEMRGLIRRLNAREK
jgi:3-dehydroquinate dehydratase type I